MSIGTDKGSAVVFDFGQDPTGQRTMPNPQGRKTFVDRLGEILPSNDEGGFQMDASGLDAQYYKSWQSLREAAKQFAAMGIDVTQAPDPGDPRALRAHEAFSRALATHFHNRELLKRGKDIQDKAIQYGNQYVYNTTPGELMTFDKFQEESDAKDINTGMIQQYNAYMRSYIGKDISPDQQEELNNYYEEAKLAIQKQGKQRNWSDWKVQRRLDALVKPPIGDAEKRQAALDIAKSTETANYARATASRAAANASNALATQRLKKAEGQGKETFPGLQELYQLAKFMQGVRSGEAGESVNNLSSAGLLSSKYYEDDQIFAGQSHGVASHYNWAGVNYDADANTGQMIYRKKPTTKMKADSRIEGRFVEAPDKPGDSKLDQFYWDDLLPGVSGIMTKDGIKNLREDLLKHGLIDPETGKVSAEAVLQYVDGNLGGGIGQPAAVEEGKELADPLNLRIE